MKFSDAPYLGAINGGAELRTACVKLQSYAAINWRNGGTFGTEVLAPFYADMQQIARKDSGTPFDGKYLGMGVRDPRRQFYKVASAVRMNGSMHDKQVFGDFLAFFRMAASSLSDKQSVVASIRVTLDGKETPDQLVPYGTNTKYIRFYLLDAEGNQVPASVDNPLLGYTQLSTTEDPNWMANYESRYSSGTAGDSVVARKPGKHTVTVTYNTAGSKVTGTITYIRLNEDGSNPVDDRPDVKAGKNGVAA